MFATDASPTWRGVEHGLELLKKGLLWRISTGEKVRIWRDQWIPRETTPKVTGRKSRTRIKWVAQLMSETKEWDVPVIRHVFHLHDAEEIL